MLKRIDFIIIFLLPVLLFCYGEGYLYWQDGDLLRCGSFALAAAGILTFILVRRKKRSYLRMRLKRIDGLTGREFEEYLRAHFLQMGYKVQMTETSSDYGADLILTRHGKTTVVQAKRYNKAVGVAAVQEVSGAMIYYEADEGMVVTNGTFTKNARKLAGSGGIELWDRETLIRRFGA